MRKGQLALCVLALCASVATRVPAQTERDTAESAESLLLPGKPGSHWIWIGDLLLARLALFDADEARFLGMISGGPGLLAPSFGRARPEIYLPETHRTRTTRGERTDIVAIYDARSLESLGEVLIPAKRANYAHTAGAVALSDDERFLAVLNLTPATSLTIVDVADRRFRGEIPTAGCGMVYPAGPRRFAMLCADGTLLAIDLDDRGREVRRAKSERFFDPQRDPVTEKGARYGNRWIFVSFSGVVHAVDLTESPPRAEPAWPLASAEERAEGWRPGGVRHLDVHASSGELYALMHQGEEDSHKEPGTEVWVHDLGRRERVRRFALRNASATALQQALEIERQGAFGRAFDWTLQHTLPMNGPSLIAVTQDAEPLLITASTFPAIVTVYDARTGNHLRDLEDPGFALIGLFTP